MVPYQINILLQKLVDELQREGCKEKMVCYRCDVTKEDEVIDMFGKITAEHGGIDVLINNAGLTRDAPLLSGDVQSWNLMLQVSISSPPFNFTPNYVITSRVCG